MNLQFPEMQSKKTDQQNRSDRNNQDKYKTVALVRGCPVV